MGGAVDDAPAALRERADEPVAAREDLAYDPLGAVTVTGNVLPRQTASVISSCS